MNVAHLKSSILEKATLKGVIKAVAQYKEYNTEISITSQSKA